VTPQVLAPGDVRPLIMMGTERLADGRVLSRARFETGPILAALAAGAAALAAHAALRRHWRDARLETPHPDRPVAESAVVLGLGALSLATYLARTLLDRLGMGGAAFAYVPLLGGLLETVTLFFGWTAILQAWRRSRPLSREWRLWVGALLALVPPVRDLAAFVLAP
jgi:hypothetical protein